MVDVKLDLAHDSATRFLNEIRGLGYGEIQILEILSHHIDLSERDDNEKKENLLSKLFGIIARETIRKRVIESFNIPLSPTEEQKKALFLFLKNNQYTTNRFGFLCDEIYVLTEQKGNFSRLNVSATVPKEIFKILFQMRMGANDYIRFDSFVITYIDGIFSAKVDLIEDNKEDCLRIDRLYKKWCKK